MKKAVPQDAGGRKKIESMMVNGGIAWLSGG
jgi:hypothetical protein